MKKSSIIAIGLSTYLVLMLSFKSFEFYGLGFKP